MMFHRLKQCLALGLLLLTAGGAFAQLKSGDNPTPAKTGSRCATACSPTAASKPPATTC